MTDTSPRPATRAAAPLQVNPMGNYASVRVAGGLAFTAGMTPRVGDRLAFIGTVGADISIEDAVEASRLSAQRALLALSEVLPGTRLTPVQLTVYIRSDPGFTALSTVADGASAVIAEALGQYPARAAIGVAALPGGAPVEVALILSIDN